MLKQIVEREYIAREKEYVIYDDYDEYLRDICGKNEYTFHFDNIKEFHTVTVNEVDYYSLYGYRVKYLLTKEAYDKLMQDGKKIYAISEYKLIRTQKNSDCQWSGDHDSEDAVIDYMRNNEGSWLPQIYKEIDEEIDELQEQINKLQEQKKTLMDDTYLRSCIKVGIEISNEKEKENE